MMYIKSVQPTPARRPEMWRYINHIRSGEYLDPYTTTNVCSLCQLSRFFHNNNRQELLHDLRPYTSPAISSSVYHSYELVYHSLSTITSKEDDELVRPKHQVVKSMKGLC
jgi:hypothetical protein